MAVPAVSSAWTEAIADVFQSSPPVKAGLDDDEVARLLKGEAEAGQPVTTVAMNVPVQGATGDNRQRAEASKFHIVRSGETLYTIARTNHIPVERLLALNGLTPSNPIYPGQNLQLQSPEDAEDALGGGELDRDGRGDDVEQDVAGLPPDGDRQAKEKREPRTIYPSRGALLSAMRPPLVGVITSSFGPRRRGFHHGLDIARETGAPIRAAQTGKVTYAGWRPVYGKTVILEHAYGVRTIYGHLSRLAVRQGDEITRGEVIGEVGSTGISTGPHLHWEVQVERRAVNPAAYVSTAAKGN